MYYLRARSTGARKQSSGFAIMALFSTRIATARPSTAAEQSIQVVLPSISLGKAGMARHGRQSLLNGPAAISLSDLFFADECLKNVL